LKKADLWGNLSYRVAQKKGHGIVRFILTCGILLAASVLIGCSSPSIPSYALASVANRPATTAKTKNISGKAIARHSHQAMVRVAYPAPGDAKISDDVSYTSAAPSKFEYVRPFSKEWDQRQAEEHRRIDSAITICRGC
jgi:hypothetical protein